MARRWRAHGHPHARTLRLSNRWNRTPTPGPPERRLAQRVLLVAAHAIAPARSSSVRRAQNLMFCESSTVFHGASADALSRRSACPDYGRRRRSRPHGRAEIYGSPDNYASLLTSAIRQIRASGGSLRWAPRHQRRCLGSPIAYWRGGCHISGAGRGWCCRTIRPLLRAAGA